MLPIEAILPDLITTFTQHHGAVLVAPPGAGKTTRVPLALLDSPWMAKQRIIMLEPRRLAARAAATRMATTLGESVGQTVGYQIRNERRATSQTRILVVTEGILTRMIQDDPGLDGVAMVIFDEFHERSLVGDTGLALTLATQALLRTDLRLLVMSATIDGAAVASLLGNAPVLISEGRSFPVSTTYHAPRPGQRMESHLAGVIAETLQEEAGSVLVFLPGAAEIRRLAGLLHQLPEDVTVYPLHGALPTALQDQALVPAPMGHRKVVLATNIAETSLTIEGIRVVVDSGWMRTPRFSPRTGMTRLETARISRASADQRRGRAGRMEPGSCRRCWSAAEDAGLVPFAMPEIREADLAPLALDLAASGFADPAELRWLDPPPAAAFAQARELLVLLGALDRNHRLTPHGRGMAALGTHPRYAHMLLRAKEINPASAARAATLVAILEERDILRGIGQSPPTDLTLRLDAVERHLDSALLGAAEIDHGNLHRVRDAAAEWHRRLGLRADTPTSDAESAGLLLAWAFPDRVAQQRGSVGRFVLRNGRGVSLRSDDMLARSPWIVVPQLDDSGRDAQVYLAAAVELNDILMHATEQITVAREIAFDPTSRSVVSRQRTKLGALTLADQHYEPDDQEEIVRALVGGIRTVGLGTLWNQRLLHLKARLAFLHQLDVEWPAVNDATLELSLEQWLTPFLPVTRKLEGIGADILRHALMARVPHAVATHLDALAPERLSVPTGSAIAIDYSDPAAPVLAVRLQELFGLMETPRIAGGRVPLTLHLLSPAGRPMQVTRDLASFWSNGYFEVRKDLRGRYPKHHWPDDPATAVPVRGIKRRK